ncbi:MAG: aminodeoxychorismate synthase component I [Pseudomonadota bacterium]
MNHFPKINIELNGIYTQEITLSGSFPETAEKFAPIPGTVILLSGGNLDCSRYHILAAKPWLSIRGLGSRISFQTKQEKHSFLADPFLALDSLLGQYQQNISPQLPVAAGLFGYLAYDLKDHLEHLPRTAVDDLTLPQLCMFAPSILLIQEKETGKTTLCIPKRMENGKETLSEDLHFFQETMKQRPAGDTGFHGDPKGFTANFTQDAYIESIRKIREYIAAGHVYQVNMSQRFESKFSGNAFRLFTELFQSNPAPFFSYIEAGDHQIVSTSPERFIQQTGDRIETRPIKGTRPRGKTPEQDRQMAAELSKSPKDDAELSMIVDLLRNDLGKVCTGGSVKVTQHKRLEAYENVFHLVSIVEGQLAFGKNAVDLIRATFPGGSITGCPKIRAMEIIDELEPCRRHIYTGSIGYISFHETMDLSIAIRTATIKKGRILFSAGGGIVYDSDPLQEFQETLHKGKTLMETVKADSTSDSTSGFVWMNGRIMPEKDAKLPITDLGVQYGYGLFETIRVNNAHPAYLKNHMDRFNTAWKAIMNADPPDLTWEDIIQQVISSNRLENQTAAVKIMATFGSPGIPDHSPNLFVSARPYIHRLAGKNEPGIHLITYPEPRQTPLANYKTSNYLYYYLAGHYAKEKKGDEALILNPDDTVSETNTANIILIKNHMAVIPESASVLSGIMANVVCDYLKDAGFTLRTAPVFRHDLFPADQVIMTNSLIGAVPVLSLDNKQIHANPEFCRQINNHIL